ncbi:MAG: MFS transporter [Methanotrichaceae archaeon]
MNPKNRMLQMMSLRDFRLLFIGTAMSLLGDQFTLIATPWLTLQLTGDPLALGLVLALEGIPRATIMLLGGAITDRFSPRIVMFTADVVRFVLTCLMAFAVFTGTIQIWMMYVFSLGFGLMSGFEIPAESSIVPTLVNKRDLQTGNSLMLSTAQVAQFVGPTVAGILIGQYSHSFFGIGLAYAIDAVGFATSATCLWLIRTCNKRQPSEESPKDESIWTSVLAGMKYLRTDDALLLIILVVAGLNFSLIGPIMVGIPVLANQRLPEGATAFGLLMSAYAGGNLIGFMMAGFLPRPGGKAMRVILISLLFAFGAVFGSLAFVQSTWVDFILMVPLGLGSGYIYIVLFSWVQSRAPKEMIGRMMSILAFSSYGLMPVSQAISGAVIKWNLNFLFVSAGVLVLLLALWTTFQPALKTFCDSLAAQEVVAKEA